MSQTDPNEPSHEEDEYDPEDDTMMSASSLGLSLNPEEESPLVDDEDDESIAFESALDGADINPLDAADADERAAELEAKLAEAKDELLRSVAEMENVRKRAQRDVEEAHKYATTKFARELVGVLENLQRAVDSISSEMRESNDQVKNLAVGVEMTLGELVNVFSNFGIKREDPMGEKFDHNRHQALSEIEDGDAEPGTVLQVMRAAYVMHDRLLLPALVGVAKRGSDKDKVNTEA